MAICASCERERSRAQYSAAQLRKKERRRCKECVGAERPAAGAAGEPQGQQGGQQGGQQRQPKKQTPGGKGSAASEEAAERQHFLDIVRSYTEYGAHGLAEVARRKRHLLALPAPHLARLPGGEAGVRKQLGTMLAAVRANAVFCRKVATEDNGYHRGFGTTPAERAGDSSGGVEEIRTEAAVPLRLTPGLRARSAARHMSRVDSALWQLAREWSAEGAAERAQCLDPMLAELARLLPVTDANRNTQRVLAPGCGAGRVVLELAVRGYAAQGNEFCYGMLLAASYGPLL